MNEQKQEQDQQEKEKPICVGGVHCLKLKDKEHSTQFIHLNPVIIHFSHTHFLICFCFVFSLLLIN
jgi:hypothetical protein